MRVPELKISIALCTFNGAAWLRDQLASIASQTRPPDELVVCDDRSSDATTDILREFAAAARFPVLIHLNERNLGSPQNFSKAIALCRGEFIFLADQDDIWLPGKIEKLAGLLEGARDAGMAFGDGEVVDAALRPMGYTLWEAIRFNLAEQRRMAGGRAAEVLLRHSVVAGASAAFRSSYRSIILPIPSIPRCGHDYWTALIISGLANFALLREPVLKYRLHGRNVVGIRRRTLREKIALGKELSQPRVFQEEAAMIAAVMERLSMTTPGAQYAPRAAVLALMQTKIDHLNVRTAMASPILPRVRAILGETINGRYFRYSQGWRSVAQDLFLR